MTNSYPSWAEYLFERISYHKDRRKAASEMDDFYSAEQHEVIADELKFILDSFGFEVER
jgi:hypothetical protein